MKNIKHFSYNRETYYKIVILIINLKWIKLLIK